MRRDAQRSLPGNLRVPLSWLVGKAVFPAVVLVAALIIATCLWIRSGSHAAALMRADPNAIPSDPALMAYAMPLGHRVFQTHCASCHASDGHPDNARGIPDLRDSDYLFGSGKPAEIEMIVLHGIRAGDSKGFNLAFMPAYASAKPYAAEPIPSLSPSEIQDVTQFVAYLHGGRADPSSVQRGGRLYFVKGGCFDCHGQSATGDPAIGAPNLTDKIWLFGDGSSAAVYRSIALGHAGTSPAFTKVLTPVEARAVAIYTASLSHRNNKAIP